MARNRAAQIGTLFSMFSKKCDESDVTDCIEYFVLESGHSAAASAAAAMKAATSWWTHDTVPCTPRHPPNLRLPTLKLQPSSGEPSFVLPPVGMSTDGYSSVVRPQWALDDTGLPTIPGVSPRGEFLTKWEARAAKSARGPTVGRESILAGPANSRWPAARVSRPRRGRPSGALSAREARVRRADKPEGDGYLKVTRESVPASRPEAKTGAAGAIKYTDEELLEQKEKELEKWMKTFVKEQGLSEVFYQPPSEDYHRNNLREEISLQATQVHIITHLPLSLTLSSRHSSLPSTRPHPRARSRVRVAEHTGPRARAAGGRPRSTPERGGCDETAGARRGPTMCSDGRIVCRSELIDSPAARACPRAPVRADGE